MEGAIGLIVGLAGGALLMGALWLSERLDRMRSLAGAPTPLRRALQIRAREDEEALALLHAEDRDRRERPHRHGHRHRADHPRHGRYEVWP